MIDPQFFHDLRAAAAGDVLTDDLTRALYSTDAGIHQMMPHAVFIPRTADDVRIAVGLAARHGVAVLPRTAGTSLAGQAVNEALVIDFTRHLDAILEINPAERWARVQPGVVLDDLNRALRPHGLQFGPDPASSNRACMGGIVANNSTGSHSIRYGMTADHVLGMEVVLADGTTTVWGQGAPAAAAGSAAHRIESAIAALVADPRHQAIIRQGTPSHWRHCGGYNLERLLPGADGTLASLVCGSEGTLAVMTEITLNLVPLPAHKGLVLLHFDELRTSLAAVPALLETDPAAIELLDDLSLRLCVDVPEYGRLLSSVFGRAPFCFLIIEYDGDSEAEVQAGLSRLQRLLARDRLGSVGLTPAVSAETQAAVWAIRKAGLGLLMSMKGDIKPVPFIEDAAVPVEHLPDYIARLEAFCAGLDVPITYYAHASAGCLHVRPLMDLSRAADRTKMIAIARRSAELVGDYGGAISSEHGDGRTRGWLNEAFFGPALYGLYRQVKQIFDPATLLNPGVIVDAGPMTDHLRRSPAAATPPLLDWRDYEQNDLLPMLPDSPPAAAPGSGLVRAIEMCNGSAVCLQRAGGTMCPSYMVTRDEQHSTRGRANALRAAMTGLLPTEALTSERMHAVMDLCIGCKACKAECPSAVDMARLKTEFLARYHAAHGTPARDRFFVAAAALNRLGSGAPAPAAAWLLRSRPGKAAMARLGIAPQRELPVPARQSFMAWWRERADTPGSMEDADLVLLVDPFTNYVQPTIGMAATLFLEAAGRRVLAVAADDGRAAISKGMVEQARRAAAKTLDALGPFVARGLSVVGLEPSSLLTLRDEYLYLLPDDPRTRPTAALALTFEEYVAGAAERGDLDVAFGARPRRVLLHGHCHQKALVGTGPARRALALPGHDVVEVDSGCCGMAGAFGYEAEHYAVSMQMAERRLLPAVRAEADETLIAAAGLSCRQQIGHGSGRTALHPAEILWQALRPDAAAAS